MSVEMPLNIKLDTLKSEGYQAVIYGACLRDSILTF